VFAIGKKQGQATIFPRENIPGVIRPEKQLPEK